MKVVIVPRPQVAGYLHRKERWACMVIHRRGGKSFVCIQDLIARALTHRREGPPLRYGYIAPTRDQARDIAFGYLERYASKISGAVVNRSDLSATFSTKAMIRLYSGEAYERLRGLYFDGIVMDEAADLDPAAWDSVIRATLTDYGGWATWVGTPKGRNAFWRVRLRATTEGGWFSLLLKASESGIIPAAELADIRAGMSEDAYRQEFECDFAVGRPGAIFARGLDLARADGRVNEAVEWYADLPCYTAWDVGAAHNQKCWVFQLVGDRINFLEAMSGGADCATPADWSARLKGKRYRYGGHFLPHDAMAENGGLWQAGFASAELSGVAGVRRQANVWDGINLALDALPRCRFNAHGCAAGLEALDAYHAKEERDGVTIRDVPVHNWASHFADAFSLVHQAINQGLIVDRSAMPGRSGGGMARVVRDDGVDVVVER